MFLRGGQFIDATGKEKVVESLRMENNLLEIENRAERLEREAAEKAVAKENERLDKLQVKRISLISKYLPGADERDLAFMDTDVWDAYFNTKKKEFEDNLKAEKEAEKKRIAEAKAEKARLEAIELENKKLKKEREEKARLDKIESDKRAKLEGERIAKEKETERLHQDKINKIDAEKTRVEKELKAKKDKDEAVKKEKEALEKSALLAPDKVKLTSWIESVGIAMPELSNKESKIIAEDILTKFKGFREWASAQIKTLK